MPTDYINNKKVYVQDADYFKNYYQKNKDKYNNKIPYCRNVYKVEFSEDDIAELGDDYKKVAKAIRDARFLKEKYCHFFERV